MHRRDCAGCVVAAPHGRAGHAKETASSRFESKASADRVTRGQHGCCSVTVCIAVGKGVEWARRVPLSFIRGGRPPGEHVCLPVRCSHATVRPKCVKAQSLLKGA